MNKRKGFTLIELIAVLVIMAILALIVTPLVMSIKKKKKISADKRSIDAYGRSIELAIAGYLLDNGTFPTSIDQLTIEYSGDEVVCTTTNLNSDSSVYLAGCTVGGRSVEGYTYGKEESVPAPTYTAYYIGDTVTYNNVNYYVIKDSDSTEESVTLLKAEPLSVEEVNTYGAGHVNRYISNPSGTAYDRNGYGGMVYYSSVDCGYGTGSNNTDTGCKNDYASSEIKYVVDAWKAAKASAASEARLTTYEELSELGEIKYVETPSGTYEYIQLKYDWLYNNNCSYWTMTPYQDSTSDVWRVGGDGRINSGIVTLGGLGNHVAVRPVITISKSEL